MDFWTNGCGLVDVDLSCGSGLVDLSQSDSVVETTCLPDFLTIRSGLVS